MRGGANSKALWYAAGIFFCYFYYGMIQESITRGSFGEGGERFTCMLSLVLCQCVFNYVFAKGMLMVWKQPADETRVVYYFSSALTYLLAMVCSNMALQWVNYPTQVIGKAAKPIPVMILGVLIGHKRYPLKKYFFVVMIVAGVVAFMFKDQKRKLEGESSSSGFGIGELLLLLSLTMDGILGAIQDRMRAETAPSAQHLMLNTNYWSCLILGAAVVLTGEVGAFTQFAMRHPVVVWQIFSLSVTSALGQLFIFLMVSQFGPLSCSIVTTTRKFFTVLSSVVLFGNVLSARQWLGAVLVFSGLFLDAFYGKKKDQVKS